MLFPSCQRIDNVVRGSSRHAGRNKGIDSNVPSYFVSLLLTFMTWNRYLRNLREASLRMSQSRLL